MKRLFSGCFVLVSSILMISCQKEISSEITSSSSSSSGNIMGNYKFISMTANTISTTQVLAGPDLVKAVTISQYTTKDNTGTMQIGATTMSTTNLSYSIDTTVKVYSYTNGVLDDSLDMPFQFTVPPSSSTAPYKMVGADSVYFSAGFMSISGTSQQTIPGGSKLRFDGDKLYMTASVSQTKTQTVQGQTATTEESGTSVIVFQKL